MALNITVTNAGRAELINADHTGTGPVTITHVAFSSSVFTPSKTLTELPEEIKRVSSIAGEVVADDTISVTAKDEGTDAYSVHSIGLISEYGTLFAVYSQPAPIIEKSRPTTLLLTIDIILADLPSASLTFGDISFSNPPASLTTPGVVTLSNATDSSAQHQAATPRAVKAANDNADTRLAKSQNLGDLPSPSQARSNLGLGAAATMGTTASRSSSSTSIVLQAKAMNDHRQSGDHDSRYPQRGNNLSDLPDARQARINLGLGASATMDTTASRTSTSTATVLQARAMNDHRQSDDHDGRYYTKSEFTDRDTPNTPMRRNGSGDVWARLFRSSYTSLNSNVAVIYTSARNDGSDYMRPSSPGQVKAALGLNKNDVGLSNLPNSTTSSRNSASTNSLLEAKAMNDHRQSGDHDGRYIKRAGDTVYGRLVLDGGAELNGYRLKRNGASSTGDDVADIYMDDHGIIFDIDNDDDGDAGYVTFRRKSGGTWVEAQIRGDGSGLVGTASLRATGTTKEDVGLSQIPNSITSSRDDPNTQRLLTARGMHDHKRSDDHDGRYARDIGNVSGGSYASHALTNKLTFFYHSTGGAPSDAPTGQQASVLALNNEWGTPYIAIPNSGDGFFWRNGNDTAWREAFHPGNLDNAFPASKGESYWHKLPNGWIEQGMNLTLPGGQTEIYAPWPTTFPNLASQYSASRLSAAVGPADVIGATLTRFGIRINLPSTTTGPRTFSITVRGY